MLYLVYSCEASTELRLSCQDFGRTQRREAQVIWSPIRRHSSRSVFVRQCMLTSVTCHRRYLIKRPRLLTGGITNHSSSHGIPVSIHLTPAGRRLLYNFWCYGSNTHQPIKKECGGLVFLLYSCKSTRNVGRPMLATAAKPADAVRAAAIDKVGDGFKTRAEVVAASAFRRTVGQQRRQPGSQGFPATGQSCLTSPKSSGSSEFGERHPACGAMRWYDPSPEATVRPW